MLLGRKLDSKVAKIRSLVACDGAGEGELARGGGEEKDEVE
jgi:hypothetical protein